MVNVKISVPTTDGLSEEFTLDIEEPEFPDGSVIQTDFTAIVTGHPGSPKANILGFVFPKDDERFGYGSSAAPVDVYSELAETVVDAFMSHGGATPDKDQRWEPKGSKE